MAPFVEIDDRNLKASLRRMERELKNPGKVYGQAARHMRDYVRQTITMQGRKRPYAPLSKWTKAKTGRRKALIPLRKYIKARWDGTSGQVYFQQRSSAWHIDMHHTGFTSPAVIGRKMVVPGKGGNIFAVFMSRKASVIPAREVWPEQEEVEKEVNKMFSTWVDDVARRTWH